MLRVLEKLVKNFETNWIPALYEYPSASDSAIKKWIKLMRKID